MLAPSEQYWVASEQVEGYFESEEETERLFPKVAILAVVVAQKVLKQDVDSATLKLLGELECKASSIESF